MLFSWKWYRTVLYKISLWTKIDEPYFQTLYNVNSFLLKQGISFSNIKISVPVTCKYIIQFCKIQSSQVQHFFTRVLLWCPDFPHQINAWLLSNRFVAFSSALFSFHRSIFISTVGFSNEENCCLSQEMGKLIKENLLKGIFRVD